MQIDFHTLPCLTYSIAKPTNEEIKSSHFGANNKRWTKISKMILTQISNAN
jgi:hypothetical protein